ncbi:MAG: hypothetical protein FWE16_01050 [Firmicutes bacterium]|nr:hypothetical protein [Bacillota bacterium]
MERSFLSRHSLKLIISLSILAYIALNVVVVLWFFGFFGRQENVVLPSSIFAVSGGGSHTLAIDGDGYLWAWGNNYFGQLGDGTRRNRNRPTRIPIDTKFKKISSGLHNNLAICIGGGLWTWGVNNSGQLGDGTRINRSTPQRIMPDKQFIAISANGNAYAIDTNNRLWVLTGNIPGEIGYSTGIPANIIQNTQFTHVSSGGGNLALDIDGNMWGWGINVSGQLGNGTTAIQPIPVIIPTPVRFVEICIAMAIDENGGLWTWGGGAGTGTGDIYLTPTQIMSERSFTAISTGSARLVADTDGNLWVWGRSLDGQLGIGIDGLDENLVAVRRTSPIHILQGKTVVSVSTGGATSFAITDEGHLWAWGSNTYGRLGDGTSRMRNVPVRII